MYFQLAQSSSRSMGSLQILPLLAVFLKYILQFHEKAPLQRATRVTPQKRAWDSTNLQIKVRVSSTL